MRTWNEDIFTRRLLCLRPRLTVLSVSVSVSVTLHCEPMMTEYLAMQIVFSSLNLEFEDILHFDTSHETDTLSLETMLSSISNKR